MVSSSRLDEKFVCIVKDITDGYESTTYGKKPIKYVMIFN